MLIARRDGGVPWWIVGSRLRKLARIFSAWRWQVGDCIRKWRRLALRCILISAARFQFVRQSLVLKVLGFANLKDFYKNQIYP